MREVPEADGGGRITNEWGINVRVLAKCAACGGRGASGNNMDMVCSGGSGAGAGGRFFLPSPAKLESNSSQQDSSWRARRRMMKLTMMALIIAAVGAVVVPLLSQTPAARSHRLKWHPL